MELVKEAWDSAVGLISVVECENVTLLVMIDWYLFACSGSAWQKQALGCKDGSPSTQ